MRVIDKTPFVDEKGQISLVNRAQAMLKFGPSWLQNIEAQQAVISRLEKHLDNKYTLLRNLTLAGTQIVVPLILVSPQGVYVLNVTGLRGTYQAKNDTWGTLDGEKYKDASINLITRTARLGLTVKKYLSTQGIELETVESVLLAADSGLHVESVRPMVRVVLSDAIDRFALSIRQGRPVLSVMNQADIVERFETPRPPSKPEPAPVPVEPTPASPYEESAYFAAEPEEESQSPIWDPNAQQSFSFQQSSDLRSVEYNDTELDDPGEQPRPAPARKPKPKRGPLGLERKQLLALVAFGLVEMCIVAGFLIYVVLTQAP